MENQFKEIPLHRLNIPTETLRQTSTNAGDDTLKKSLEMFGVLSPLVVTELGSRGDKTEYAIWDGTRRTRLLRDLNQPTTTRVPCMVVQGDDRESLVHQVNINNTRERLSEFAEAEALRQLVQDHGMKQVEAAGKLMKSKQWASDVMKVWSLPKDILGKVQKGVIPISHARILGQYKEDRELMNVLALESESGDISFSRLKALAVRASSIGIKRALSVKPKTHSFGSKSKIRVEPLQQSMRLELQIDDSDDITEAMAKMENILTKLRTKTSSNKSTPTI